MSAGAGDSGPASLVFSEEESRKPKPRTLIGGLGWFWDHLGFGARVYDFKAPALKPQTPSPTPSQNRMHPLLEPLQEKSERSVHPVEAEPGEASFARTRRCRVSRPRRTSPSAGFL